MKKIFLFILFFPTVLFGQKLPDVQKDGVRIPGNLKIDGLANEWDSHFSAFNNATEVYYTIANDDKTLYFIIQARKNNVIYKILNGGLTITIDTVSKKDTKHRIQILYPFFDRKNYPMIDLQQKPVLAKNSSVNNEAQIDSFRLALNQELSNKSKEVKVKGIQSIPDSLISVFNEYRIKVNEGFDKQFAYNIEVQIPLSALNINLDKIFYYNIMLKGSMGSIPQQAKVTTLLIKPEHMSALYNTDFWGEYKLIK